MALKKRIIPLNIMESTDQITADKISLKPSNIENIRFEKTGEATKRYGLKSIGGAGIAKVIPTIGNSGYVGNASGFSGIDPYDDEAKDIIDTPFLTIGVNKKKVYSSSSEIRAIAHARGEKYHFVAYHPRTGVSVRQESKAYLLDDDFNIIKDISGSSPYLALDYESVQIVSYTKNGYEWVTIIIQLATTGSVYAVHFDENGDYNSQDAVFASSTTKTIAAVSTGTGYYIGGINSANNFVLSLYDGSSHTTVTATTAAFSNYGVGSITYFSDYVIAIINPIDPSGATTEAKLVRIPLSSWATSIAPVIYSLIVGGSYLPKWGTVTKVDTTYYVISLTDYDASTDEVRSLITRMAKTSTSLATGILTERCSSIGHVFIDIGRAYALLMTQNGYNPIYHLVRVNLTSKYYETISSFLSGQAPTTEFYANGMVGQNTIQGQDQLLYRSQPTFSTTVGKLFTIVPVQPLGQDFANWRSLEFDFNSPVDSMEAHGLSAIASGCFGTWDGSRYIRGVTAYPEIISVSSSGVGFNYQYIPVYRTIDGNGNKVRSLVGPVFSYSTATATSSISVKGVTFAKKALLFNDYPSSSNGVEQGVYELYRTEHNGIIFYKTAESLYAGAYFISDSTDDGDLIDNELLYTTGGVLENTYPETCNSMCYSNGRLWTVGDGDLVHYSKEFVEGQSISFNDGLVYKVGGLRNIAIARLGKRQLVLKERSCNIMWGNPATNIGTGQSLTHQELSSSIGCSNPDSVVEIDNGVIFESHKGFYQVSTNSSLSFVGKDVIDYTNNNTCTNSAHIKDSNEVIFAFSSGIVLVYNYLFGIWNNNTTNLSGTVNAVYAVAGNAYYNSNGLYRAKNSSDSNIYSDTNGLIDSDYKMSYSTGWLKLAGISGFQRCYRLFVVGSKTTAQSIKVTVYNDYDDITPSQTRTFALAATDPLEFELHIARQKGEAIKFVIEELNDVANSDLKINSLSIQIGVKRGFNKLSPDLRL